MLTSLCNAREQLSHKVRKIDTSTFHQKKEYIRENKPLLPAMYLCKQKLQEVGYQHGNKKNLNGNYKKKNKTKQNIQYVNSRERQYNLFLWKRKKKVHHFSFLLNPGLTQKLKLTGKGKFNILRLWN